MAQESIFPESQEFTRITTDSQRESRKYFTKLVLRAVITFLRSQLLTAAGW